MNARPFPARIRRIIAGRDRSPGGLPWCAVCHATSVALQLHHVVMQAYDMRRSRLTADDGEMRCHACHAPETRMQRAELGRAQRLAERDTAKRAAGQSEIGRRFGQENGK